MTISERIYLFMEKRGMTQLEFSERTGISQSTVSDWRRKKTNPSADKLATICGVLGVTPNELLLNDLNPSERTEKEGTAEQQDYMIVTKGNERYELLVEFDSLKKRDKERLIGYLHALMK